MPICACGDHAFVKSSHWHVVLVSAQDASVLKGASVSSNPAFRPKCATAYWSGTKTYRKVHHLVLAAGAGRIVDHVNRNTLDNRRSNLRLATYAESARNRGALPGHVGLKGVQLGRQRGTFEVFITANGKRKYVGKFTSKADAAAAYNAAAIELHGYFAVLNDMDRLR